MTVTQRLEDRQARRPLRVTFREIDRKGTFETTLAGERVYKGRQPIYGGARALIAAGHDPETQAGFYTGQGTLSMRGTLASFARWTVHERSGRGMQLAKWAPDSRWSDDGAPTDAQEAS